MLNQVWLLLTKIWQADATWFAAHPWALWVFAIAVPIAIAVGLRAGQIERRKEK